MTDLPNLAIIDDDRDNRTVAGILLGDEFAVAEFESGPSFFAAVADQTFSLVLVDLSLPEMNGFAIVEKIRKTAAISNLLVYAFTAHCTETHRAEARSAGFDGFITKPVLDWPALIDELKQALDCRSACSGGRRSS